MSDVLRRATVRSAVREPLGPALQALADRVGRLGPNHRDPERFHVEKDEIRAELRRLARETA